MEDKEFKQRDIIFLSKATPGDDAFALWLAPRLELAGYHVFADILQLDTGDRWRQVITQTLQDYAIKMLLCCSDETLGRSGVLEEIDIATDLVRELGDPNFILPLKMRRFKKVFGIAGLQYIDFEASWADGLSELLKSLDRQQVPKQSNGVVQPHWEQYLRRKSVEVEHMPEPLTSNWLRLIQVPDELVYLHPKNPFKRSTLLELGRSFEYPMVPYLRGFLTFCTPVDLGDHFLPVGPMEVANTFDFQDFMENGSETAKIEPRDASNITVNLLRQAWEKLCLREGFLAHEYSNGTGFHVDDSKTDIGRRIPWGRQGERRSSMLRNIARGKVWEYGVSAIPSLFPFPHLRLKGRVLFSDMPNRKKTLVIDDKDKQHRLRRSICSGWRNKAWHGRLMAFMELVAGESPHVMMPVGGGNYIKADAMPIQFTSPVTTVQSNRDDDDAEESDPSTLGGYRGGENI